MKTATTMNRQGYALILIIAILFLFVGITLLTGRWSDPMDFAVSLFALNGYLVLTITTLMTPFLREVSQAFGKGFLRIHHIFAIVGITFVTLHPISYAIQALDLTVFAPSFASWYNFWLLAGRPTLILLYVAVAFALVRRRTFRFWRGFHSLVYIVLLFGIVHATS